MSAKKISTSEVGHAKNIAHFELMIEICGGYGDTYTPSNGILELTKLTTKLNICKKDMLEVQNKKNAADACGECETVGFCAFETSLYACDECA